MEGPLVIPRMVQMAGRERRENGVLWKSTGTARNLPPSAKAAVRSLARCPLVVSNPEETAWGGVTES